MILNRITGDDPEMLHPIQEARIAREIGQMIYDARASARLTQQQLVERVGIRQSVIARLANADYEGHSLRMLKRVAEALRGELVLQFVPVRAIGRARAARPTRALPTRQRRSSSRGRAPAGRRWIAR